MNELSEDKVKEIKEAFEIFDEDKDGYLNKNQLQLTLMCLGYNLQVSEVDEIFENFSLNKEEIDFKRFADYLGKRNKEYDFEEELMECFEDLDKDKDGKISDKELKYALLTLGEELSDGEIKELIDQVNPNGNGYFDYKDFLKLMLLK